MPSMYMQDFIQPSQPYEVSTIIIPIYGEKLRFREVKSTFSKYQHQEVTLLGIIPSSGPRTWLLNFYAKSPVKGLIPPLLSEGTTNGSKVERSQEEEIEGGS